MSLFLFKAFEFLLSAFSTLFGVAIGLLIVLMGADIFMRDLRLGSLPWLIEITEYTLYAGTFLAAPWVLRQGQHVRVDILLMSVSKRVAVRLEQFVDLCGLGISLVLLWYGASASIDAFRTDMIQFKTWNYPEWLLLLPIPLGFTLLSIEFVLRICRVRGVVKETYDIADRASI